MKRKRAAGGLRQGFTTGTAATAAAKAALTLLLCGHAPARVDAPLPGGGRLGVDVAEAGLEGDEAVAWVVKDAGDDPDATHGARIGCRACLAADLSPGGVRILGGSGVGLVTRPGLPVAVGQAAINPGPMAQIAAGAREALALAGRGEAVRLVIEVQDGQALAAKTLNPRLGITGGISILGTAGIVKPFSHAAWRATIESGLAVASAAGAAAVGLSTGRRSERLLMARHADLAEVAMVQVADFFAFSMERAARLHMRRIVWGCYFGKLAKMAQGLEYTHAHQAPTDFAELAVTARLSGAGRALAEQVAKANTARHALELLPEGAARRAFSRLTAARALAAARRFAGPGPDIMICCFDFKDALLVEVSQPGGG